MWEWFTAVFWLFLPSVALRGSIGKERQHCAVICYDIQFPAPVSWKLTISLLTVHSLLLCLLCTVIYYSPVKGWSSISECCFCSFPGHALLVVVCCWNRSHQSFSEVNGMANTLLIPFPWSTLLARRSRAVVFTLFPQDSWGIAISDRDDQAKAELPGITQVWRPRAAHLELKSLYHQQRHISNSTGEKAGE